MFNMSEAISYEVRAHYNGYKRQGLYNVSDNGLTCMSPVINIMRHPLWGRNQVYMNKQFYCFTVKVCANW